MARVIETRTLREWFDIVKLRFDLSRTRLQETEEALSIFLSEDVGGGRANIMVARFCKTTHKGVVFDRREQNRENKE